MAEFLGGIRRLFSGAERGGKKSAYSVVEFEGKQYRVLEDAEMNRHHWFRRSSEYDESCRETGWVGRAVWRRRNSGGKVSHDKYFGPSRASQGIWRGFYLAKKSEYDCYGRVLVPDGLDLMEVGARLRDGRGLSVIHFDSEAATSWHVDSLLARDPFYSNEDDCDIWRLEVEHKPEDGYGDDYYALVFEKKGKPAGVPYAYRQPGNWSITG